MRKQTKLYVEQLESRCVMSVVTVPSGREYHFTDSHSVDQHVAVWGGSARLWLSDLPGGGHEILSAQLLGRGLAVVAFEASTNVPLLTGQRVGAVAVGGDLGTFTALSVSGNVDVAGSLGQFRALVVDGSVHVGGSLGSLTVGSFRDDDLWVEGDLVGNVQVLRGLESIHVGLLHDGETGQDIATGGVVHGSIRIISDLVELDISEATETARIAIGGDLATLEVVGSLGGSVRVNGSLGSAKVGGDLRGRFAVVGDVDRFDVSGNVPLLASFVVNGAVENASFAGAVAGRIALGELTSTLIVSGTLYGSVRIVGDAHEIAAGYSSNEATQELESTGATVFGSISVGGSLDKLELGGGSADTASIRVVGDIGSLVSEGDVAGRIVVQGSVTEFNTWGQMQGFLAIWGDLGFFVAAAGQSSESVIRVRGHVGGMEFGADVEGLISAPLIDYVMINGCLLGTIQGVDPENLFQTCGGDGE